VHNHKIKVIGLGGIGTYLVEPLARYLSHQEGTAELTLIDGDAYEEKNRQRQRFSKLENKASVSAEILKEEFPKLHFRSKPQYVTEDNVISLIREGDLVFLCVDNHATRKLVSDRCAELRDVTLISGGNDYTDGNVIYYKRQNGQNITKSPTTLYPKIAKPEDKNPGDEPQENREGCQEMAESSPQLLFANLAVASCMLNVFYAHENQKADFEQVYVDIVSQRSRPVPEKVIKID
jgi:molybdopterin/thiamine biosynthesis adenylyltransferase